MAIALRASGKSSVDLHLSAAGSIAVPTGATTGDLMIMVVSVGFNGTIPALTTPTGWTVIATGIGPTSSGEKTYAFYRLWLSGDSSWSLALTSYTSSPDLGAVIQTFSGCNATTPIDATGTTSTNTGSLTLSAPAVTVATANAWWLIGCGCYSNGSTPVYSASGMTDVDNGSAVNESVGLLYQGPVGTGSTGAITVTSTGTASGNSMSCIPFAIRPAAGVSFLPQLPFPGIPGALLAI